MTDVALRQTDDGGEIEFVNGAFVMSDGLKTAVYLSLFGGNESDSGLRVDDSAQWWGNLGETLAERRYRSETQFLLRSIPPIPANLRRIENAIAADLAWMLDTKLATFVGAIATMPAKDTVKMAIRIEIDGRVFPVDFTESWSIQ